MKWSSIGSKWVALAAAVLMIGIMGATASAVQYPPPTGNVSMTASNAAPAAGSTISISATAMDPTGAVLANLACTFNIVSQPGTSAVVDAGPKTTNASGVATTSLNVGTTAGTVVVGTLCGELSSQVTVQVAAAAGVRMPATGTGPVDSAPYGLAMIAGLLAGGLTFLFAGSALCVVARRVRGS